MGNLIFDGVSTEDLGLVIQAPPAYTFPAKDLSTSHVPGRNGDLILDNYCYNNVDRTYSIASVFRPGTSFVANSEKIIEWLTSPSGYRRLEDTYDPLVYRMAMFSSSGSLSNYYDQATSISITFNCKPQRFLKIGERQLDFSDSEITITNPTTETALPLITISGIPKTTDNDILLVTVSNVDSGEVSSSITVSKLPNDENSVTIDSEEQVVYYEDSTGTKKDRNEYLNFNGTNFPELGAGQNKVTISKYTQSSAIIEKYNNLLADNQLVLAAKYQPYDAIIESRQQSFFVKKYTKLKLDTEEVYDAKAYLNLCNDKAETFSFKSLNSLLNTYGQVAAFIGADSTIPEWLSVTDNGNGTITCRLANSDVYTKMDDGVYGGYVIGGSDKRIKFVSGGGEIGTFKDTAIVNISFYKAKLVAIGSTIPMLDIAYTDVPSWLMYEIQYTDSNNTSPSKIIYKAATDSAGYYYSEKTGIFSKASWQSKAAGATLELGSATWSTWKKAFTSTSGLSISTTASFDYKYLSEAPQYDDVTDTTTDSDGDEVTEVISKVYFSIRPTQADLTKITASATAAGYFRLNDAGLSDGFKYVAADNTIGDYYDDSTKANTIYYLKGIPNYSADSKYPSWLYPNLYNSDGSLLSSINPSSINFKVKTKAYYRYSHTDSEGTTTYTDWVLLDADTIWQTNFKQDEAYTLYMITEEDKLSDPFDYTDPDGNDIPNIGFYDKNDNVYAGNEPPAWVIVSREKGAKDDGSADTIRYDVGKSGYFKWDANLEWVYLEKGIGTSKTEIVSSTLTDDTTIYYLETLPQYKITTPVHMEIETATNGNPNNVKVLASTNGYYKSQTENDWIYYNINATISEIKVSESTTVDYLIPDSSETSATDIKISIIPRWWQL